MRVHPRSAMNLERRSSTADSAILPLYQCRVMRILTIPLIILLVAPCVVAQPVDRERIERLAVQLLDQGADGAALAELGRADDHTAEVFEQLGPEYSSIVREGWQSAFSEERLRRHVVDYFARNASATSAESALQWLQQPEVRRATQRMRDGTGPDFNRQFGEWAIALTDDDVDDQRLELITMVSERSGQETVGQIVMTMAEAGVRGGHAVAPRTGRLSLDDALGQLRALGPTIEAQAISQNRLYLYYVLRDLTPAQLNAYAEALNTTAGRWYVRNMAQAFLYALDQATDEMVANVQAAAPARR